MKKNINKKNIKDQTKKILSKILEIKFKKISDKISIDTEVSWNSVNQIEIIFDLEKTFKVKFKESEYPQMISLENILRILEKYKGSNKI